MRILLLDLTHGGDAIASEYLARGDEVTVVDVYRTAPTAMRRSLKEKGVRVLLSAPSEQFDLLVSPIHCPDRFILKARFTSRITHHEAVGQLARFKVPVVEVTGSGAKTSTVHLLGHLLRNGGKRVLMLSSRGSFLLDKDDTKMIEPRTSIAPASVLRMSKLELGQDIAVMEVSLGGTGSADVGVITSLENDYPIAQGTRHALDGKSQMMKLLKGMAVFPATEKVIWEGYLPPGRMAITFGTGGDYSLLLPERLEIGKPIHAAFRTPECFYGFSMPGDFIGAAYATALDASFATMVALGEDLDAVTEALESFHGVPGRGELTSRPGGWTLLDRNPGITASSIDWLLGVLERDYRVSDLGVVIDPVSLKVCEKLDLALVRKVLSRHPSVKGAYLSETAPGAREGFELIPSRAEAESRHKVLLWCTKEGYT